MESRIICTICQSTFSSQNGLNRHTGSKKCQDLASKQTIQPVQIQPENIDEQTIDQVIIDNVFEVISYEISEDEQGEIIDTSLNLSNITSTASQAQCHQCLQHVEDFTNVKIICHSCQVAHPTNNKQVDVDMSIKDKLDIQETLFDWRPTINNGNLYMFAPTINQTNQFIQIKTIKFSGVSESKDIDIDIYRATVKDIKHRYNKEANVQQDRRSLFFQIDLDDDVIKQLYQQNPQISESKNFAMKMLLDYPNIKFADRLSKKMIIYIDTETSTCDDIYIDLPRPSNQQHRLTIIQFLVDHCDESRPKQYIYHMKGYQYDKQTLRNQFNDVDIIFEEFATERQMVDSFWLYILEQKSMIILTGFNACHEILQRENDQFVTPKDFLGYDMKWLTARSSYRFTPINTQLKLKANCQTAYSQIKEIPNMICVDYQAVLIKPLDQKLENSLPSYSLKDMLSSLQMIDQTSPILKIDQSIYQLQKDTHQQMILQYQRVDMTNHMAYSINDTVCLWRCEQLRRSLTDLIFTPMEFSDIGASQAISFTANALNILEIGRMRLSKGLHYYITPISHDDNKMTGAYTNNDDEWSGKPCFHILQLDYSSLYPSIIINYQIDPSNFVDVVSDISQYDNNNYSIIDVSDDNKFKTLAHRSFAIFKKQDNAIMPTIAIDLLKKRKQYKNLYEHAKQVGDKINEIKNNQLQLQTKVQANALFGGMSSQANPYFKYIIGASITAGARRALQQANKTCHQLLGFKNGVKIVDQPEMIQIQKDGVSEWKRCYYNTQQDATTRINQNDTDAVFFQINDLQWCVDMLTSHKPIDQINKQFGDHFTQMEKQFCELLKINLDGSDILTMAYEEIILALYSSYSKKSYIRLEVKDQFISDQTIKSQYRYAEIIKSIMVDDKIDINLLKQAQREKNVAPTIIKGVQWSLFSQEMRQEITDMFTEICIGGNIEQVKTNYKQRLLKEFQEALQEAVNGDITHIQKFATRVRRSGKSGKCKHLQTIYPHLTDNYIYTLPLKRITKQQKMAELILPINELNRSNYRAIDQLAVFDSFESQCKKFFQKNTKTNIQRKQIAEQIEEDEVMVRVETATNKQANHFSATPEYLESLVIQTRGKQCLHEVIYGDRCKLFFDLDKEKVDIYMFDRKVRQFLEQNHFNIGDVKMTLSERVDVSVKYSYHIIYHVVMPITLVERIAARMQKIFPSVDLQVYTTKTLRINGSLKFNKDKTIDMTSMITSNDKFADTLVSYIYGYPEVDEPIALSKSNILNFNNQSAKLMIDDKQMPDQYNEIINKLIIESDSEDKPFKIASVKSNQQCPCCLKIHANDNDKTIHFYHNQRDIVFVCKRSRKNGGQAIVKVALSKEQRQTIKETIKNRPIAIDMNFAYERFIPTQNNDHLVMNFDEKTPLYGIKSNMGTGKTEQLIRWLKSYMPNHNVVMLSVRQTLSTSWMTRYQQAGINVADYRDIKGRIEPQQNVIQIIQVDSLGRLEYEQLDLVILDEVESIFAQLNSTQLRDKTRVQTKFIDLIQYANQVIAMDAGLTESSLKMLETIKETTAHIEWNDKQTYGDYNVTLRKFRKQGSDHLINCFLNKLKEGKRIVGHINSKNILDQIEAAVKRDPELQHINMITYHGDNFAVEESDIIDGCDIKTNKEYHLDRKRRDLLNVNETWSKADLVLFTGTLTAGIDFSMSHFHENISVFSSQANSAQQFCQGLMRVRKLIDKQMTIYIQCNEQQYNVSPHNIFQKWISNTHDFDISSEHLNSTLFNFQIFLHAFDHAINVRPIDYITATLNQMGMTITSETLQKIDMESKQISKDLGVTSTDKITESFLQSAPYITQQAIDFMLETNEQKRQSIVESHINENLTSELRVFQYISTTKNKHLMNINAFKDKKLLETEINKALDDFKSLSSDVKKQKVTEFKRYLEYKSSTKDLLPDSSPIYYMSDDDIDKHFKTLAHNNANQYSKKQTLKQQSHSDIMIGESIRVVKSAMTFYKAFISDVNENELQQLAKQVNNKWERRANWQYIFARLGLSYSSTLYKHCGKQRSYMTTLKPFFEDDIIFERSFMTNINQQ